MGIGKGRLGHIAAYQEEKKKLAEMAPNPMQQMTNEKLARPDAVKPLQETNTSVMPQAQVESPYLDKMTWKNTGIVPMPGQGEYRQEALSDMNEEQFKANQDKMNASEYEYWTEQLKANPGSEYAIVNQMLASKETPDEKAKRERREQLGDVFNNLGNLIGNAANLYYTNKGGQYIDLNTANEKHRERMQRIKDKQDALDRQREQIILNAKLGDAKAQRAEKLAYDKMKYEQAAKEKDNAFKLKLNAYLKELDNAHKLGQIDAQTKAKLAEQAAKAKSDKELEAFRQQNRIALKTTPGADESKVLTSLTGSDGGTWTRNTQLSKEELRELSKYVEDWSPYTKVDEDGKETIDYLGAIADASDSGLIPDYVLEEKGFKRSKDSARRNRDEGFSFASQNNGFSFK
jgi:hypothetical protein